MLERGLAKEARPYSSMAKNHVARLLCKGLDDAIQMPGGHGYSDRRTVGAWYKPLGWARTRRRPEGGHDAVRRTRQRRAVLGAVVWGSTRGIGSSARAEQPITGGSPGNRQGVASP